MMALVWLRRLGTNQRGSNVVEYVGISGIALITAGLIIAAIVAGRFQLGAAMAVIHERQVASFEGGLGGQANTDAALQPTVRAPGLVTVRTVPSLTLAVPQLVVATGSFQLNLARLRQP